VVLQTAKVIQAHVKNLTL